MAKVTPGFKLYLYQLLARELGFGKQTLLPQVEEVLAADDIIPADLECATMQDLAKACSDFLKVTVFKKGRMYITVLRNEEWDQMLAAPDEKPAPKKGGSGGGPKTWKKKKGGKKTLKAVKPGKQRREREAAEARAAAEVEAARVAAEAEQAERVAAEAAQVERAVTEPIALEAAGLRDADAASTAAGIPVEGEGASSTDAATGDAADSTYGARALDADGLVPAEHDARQAAIVGTSVATDGPRARTVAEILAEARAAEAAQSEDETDSAPAAPSAPVPEPDAPAQVARTAEETSLASTPQPQPSPSSQPPVAPSSRPVTAPEPASDATPESVSTVAVAPTPAPAPSGVATASAPAPEAASIPAPPAPEPAPISITITYDPYEDMERELERQRLEEPPVRPMRPQAPERASKAAPAKPIIPLADLPQSFGTEVSCKDALLRTLYQLLPYDVDPMTVLDEDWRMARSTSSLSGSRHRVTFPLRYLHEDGSPITVTLRKTTKSSFGKQWNLTLVDGDDGTGETHLAVGFEGLPSVDEGAWSDLSGRTTDVSASPIRMLTEHVVVGTWDSFLGALSAAAAPERWNYPGEGVGRQSRFGILREYIATTYLRAVRQERVASSTDGTFAAFHTGLSTPLGDDIYACLTKRAGDIPWQFAGFATAGSGELGARLTGTISELPLAPTYLSSLDDVVADQRRMVILDTESILGRQLGRLPRAFLLERLEGNTEANAILAKRDGLSTADLTRLSRAIKGDASAYRRLRRALDDAVEQAMRTARASYRSAAPVFDPTDERTKLLVPLCLVEDGRADCALVLDLQPSGAYRAAAILSLPRAYACARVISREQPRWLAASTVL